MGWQNADSSFARIRIKSEMINTLFKITIVLDRKSFINIVDEDFNISMVKIKEQSYFGTSRDRINIPIITPTRVELPIALKSKPALFKSVGLIEICESLCNSYLEIS